MLAPGCPDCSSLSDAEKKKIRNRKKKEARARKEASAGGAGDGGDGSAGGQLHPELVKQVKAKVGAGGEQTEAEAAAAAAAAAAAEYTANKVAAAAAMGASELKSVPLGDLDDPASIRMVQLHADNAGPEAPKVENLYGQVAKKKCAQLCAGCAAIPLCQPAQICAALQLLYSIAAPLLSVCRCKLQDGGGRLVAVKRRVGAGVGGGGRRRLGIWEGADDWADGGYQAVGRGRGRGGCGGLDRVLE